MGNLSTDPSRGGQSSTLRLAGFLVTGQICVPRTHPYALWLLPWIEALLSGRKFSQLLAAPPWPVPPDRFVTQRLVDTLIDLRWAVPAWARANEVVLDPCLEERFRTEGRRGLVETLFDAEVLEGEWWVDALEGTVLSRQTAARFDWDLRRTADEVLEPVSDGQTLLEANHYDLRDLVAKLGGVEDVWRARERAFLAAPLRADVRKDIFFQLAGNEGLLPEELGALEAVLSRHSPRIRSADRASAIPPAIVKVSPAERLATEVESLQSDALALGPREGTEARIRYLLEMVGRQRSELGSWLADSQSLRPVVGSADTHFQWLRTTCQGSEASGPSIVLITSAFLNPINAVSSGGLAEMLARAGPAVRFLVLYGHANDDLPGQQQRHAAEWRRDVESKFPTLRGRLAVVAAKRRSHEKVIITGTGDWMVGSWNSASSKPSSPVFEASLTGRDRSFAKRLLEHIRPNIEGESGQRLAGELDDLLSVADGPRPNASRALDRLSEALALLLETTVGSHGVSSEGWHTCLQAVRSGLKPFQTRSPLSIVDERQTRDFFVSQLVSLRSDLLISSDRFAEHALDVPSLRDLRSSGAHLTRVVWGRETKPGGGAAAPQLRESRRAVAQARDYVGPSLLTSDRPMGNHAKVILADGRRGLVTSQNLLAQGGERGSRWNSREIGLAFWSPAVTRHLLGAFLLRWPSILDASVAGITEPPLAWMVAGNEAWHGAQDGAEFSPESAIADEANRRHWTLDWSGLARRAGYDPLGWVRDEGERLGLVAATIDAAWRPYDAPDNDSELGLHAAARAASSRSKAAASKMTPPPGTAPAASNTRSAVVSRVLDTLIEVPAGTFLMGDDRVREESPRHEVRISSEFLIGRTPVTQETWEAVMGKLPHLRDVERHPEFPVIHVGHSEILRFLDRLNDLPGGGGFALPTEAQWEYACRAGSEAHYCFGDDPGGGSGPGPLEEFAWTKRNAKARLQKVGQLRPNAFGLYDMHGLVYETMRDGQRTYSRAAVQDPVGPLDGSRIVARGGFWGRWPVDPRRPWQEHFRCSSRQIHEKSHRVSFRLIHTGEGG